MASIFRRFAKKVVYTRSAENLLHLRHGALPRILTYHRFPESADQNFSRQCEFLRRHYNPVSLDRIVASLRDGLALPPRSVGITIDDGYLDAYQRAAPTLQAYGLPATIFAVSGFVDGGLWLWWDRIAYAFQASKRTSIELDLKDHGTARVRLDGAEQRRSVAEKVCATLVRSDNSGLAKKCDDVIARLGVSAPESPEPPYEAMTWSQAREIADQGIGIGAHTMHHWVLGTLGDAEARRNEIVGSKARMQDMLDRPVDHFGFPNGGVGDFGHDDLRIVRGAGFVSSVCSFLGLVQPDSDPYQIPRINVDSSMDLNYFRMKIAGLFHYSAVNLPRRPPAL